MKSPLLGLACVFFAGSLYGATDLAVSQSDSEDPVALGTNIVYAIFLINNGPAPATNVVLTDALPANVTFQSVEAPDGWTCTPPQIDTTGVMNCSSPQVEAGQTVGITLILRPTTIGVASNVVTATASDPDTHAENNTESEETTVVATKNGNKTDPTD